MHLSSLNIAIPVHVPSIETTSVVDGSQEMTLAEAQGHLGLTTEADLLKRALAYRRGAVVADFDRLAEELEEESDLGDVRECIRSRSHPQREPWSPRAR
jgi:hypothetical protein